MCVANFTAQPLDGKLSATSLSKLSLVWLFCMEDKAFTVYEDHSLCLAVYLSWSVFRWIIIVAKSAWKLCHVRPPDHIRIFIERVYVFLLLSMYLYSYCSSMYSYCCLGILIVRPCILIVVYVFLLLSKYSYCSCMYSYCCLCILIDI